jgi:hypothetical protein
MSNVIRPTQFNALADFRRWESAFDVALKNPSARLAWQTLTQEDCNPDALKSALYYAAYTTKSAYELPKEFVAFSRAREATLQLLRDLQRTLRTPAFGKDSIADKLFLVLVAHVLDLPSFTGKLLPCHCNRIPWAKARPSQEPVWQPFVARRK